MKRLSKLEKTPKKSTVRTQQIAITVVVLAIAVVIAIQYRLAFSVEHSQPLKTTQRERQTPSSNNEGHPQKARDQEEQRAQAPPQKPPTNTQQQQQQQPPGRYLTYGRFPGRLNNQVFQLVSALQHAVILNRTLIVPPEMKSEHWTGMLGADNDILGMWDFEELNARYSIDWTTAAQHPVNVTPECQAKRHHDVLGKRDQWNNCPIVHMGGSGGLMFCKQHHRFCSKDAREERVAYDIFKYLKISPEMRQFIPKQKFSIGVHSRTIGGNPPYPSIYCIIQVHKVTRSHISKDLQPIHDSNSTCADYCALWTNLETQLAPKYRSILRNSETSNDTAFFLASDGSYDWGQDFRASQFYMTDFKPLVEWLLKKYDAGVESDHSQISPHLQSLYQPNRRFLFEKQVKALASAILDIYTLVDQTYFVSCPISTVAMTVCLLRGEELKYESNVCWMLLHPDSLHAVFPEYLLKEKATATARR